jgi:hypothetical protein
VNPFDPGAKATPTRVGVTSKKETSSSSQGGAKSAAQSTQSESETGKIKSYIQKLLKFLRERSNKASDRTEREMYSRAINSLVATEITNGKQLIEWFKKQLLSTVKYGKSRSYIYKIEDAIEKLFLQKDIVDRILADQHMHINIAVLFERLHEISQIPDHQERTIPVNEATGFISRLWSTGYVPKGESSNPTERIQTPVQMKRLDYASTNMLEKSLIEDAIQDLPNPNYDGETPKGDAIVNQIFPSNFVPYQNSHSSYERMQMDNNALGSEFIRKVLYNWKKSGKISSYRELKGDGNMLYFEYTKGGNKFIIVPVPPIKGYKEIYVGSKKGFMELLEKNITRIVYFENSSEAFRIIIGEEPTVLYDSTKPPVCRRNNKLPAECKTAPNVWRTSEKVFGF